MSRGRWSLSGRMYLFSSPTNVIQWRNHVSLLYNYSYTWKLKEDAMFPTSKLISVWFWANAGDEGW